MPRKMTEISIINANDELTSHANDLSSSVGCIINDLRKKEDIKKTSPFNTKRLDT